MKKQIGTKKKKTARFEALDDDCALCKLMESGEDGDMRKLMEGLAEMATRANLNPKSGIVAGSMPKISKT